MTVKPFHEKYTPDARRICLITAGLDPDRRTRETEFTLNLYCDCYLVLETAFVLMDENDQPVGYILCAPDFSAYREHMKPYLKKIADLGEEYFQAAKENIGEYESLSSRYPAHLHVDILEPYTGKGGGRLLMETLLSFLKENSVPGVMLAAGADNARAIGFYSHLGFETLKKDTDVCVMGRSV